MGVPCPRCKGCGSVDELKKIEVHPDGKTCSYWQSREICNYCEGKCFMDEERIPKVFRQQ